MARVLVKPKEWMKECPKCNAVIGYTHIDLQKREDPKGYHYCSFQCPNCDSEISVSRYENERLLIKEEWR